MPHSLRTVFCGAAILSAAGAVAQQPATAQSSYSAVALPAAAPTNGKAAELPDAPLPQRADGPNSLAGFDGADLNGLPGQAAATGQSGASPQQPEAGQNQHEKAAQQIKKQEQQRAFGIVPSFNTSFTDDAVPLSKGQKMQLAFHSSIDPYTFAEAALFGGYRELNDNYSGYGWGAEGYGKRVGSAYADSFLGNMIGNGALPGLLHQEPRYFRLGHGSFFHRLLYAAASAVRCRHDGTHKWEPNYSNVGGNILAGAISNVYYPQEEKGWKHTFGDGMVNTATGVVGTVFQEFWLDLAHKMPRKGQTAQP